MNQNNKQGFSTGCQACQKGQWICIFLTYECPADCRFCPAPFKDDHIYSDFGPDPEKILQIAQAHKFKGISFSGGDPFSCFDRLQEWLSFFKTGLPGCYYWAYTSGIRIQVPQLRILSDIGLDELRFNIAATGYDHERVLDTIRSAVEILNAVAVEIPSIPSDYNRLIRVLPALDRMGVRFLNLHEYILTHEDDTVSSPDRFVFDNGQKVMYDSRSHQNTMRIMQFCHQHKLSIKVNPCSLQQKDIQMKMRKQVNENIFEIF